ncbi:DUF3093 family protein [Microbacteriaceae bacterium VKM Ac-2854]|nr:DUF3093 family protein [Microbacteriaceae bacterium VKM Ac-2854]
MTQTIRDRFAAASLWLPLVVLSLSATAWFDRLPSTLATQWNSDGVSSSAPMVVVLGITGALALAAAIVGLISLAEAAADMRRGLVLGAGFVSGLSTGIWLVTAGVALDGASPADPGGLPLLGVLAGAYAIVPFLLSPRREHSRGEAAPVAVALGESETGAWFTTLRVPLFFWLATVAGVAAAAVGIVGSHEVAGVTAVTVVMAILVLAFLVFARLRVSVDRRGLRVVSSVFRLPIARIPLAEVDSAQAESIRPVEWGGWGYRFLPGRSAVVLTGGPAIVVRRRNGTRFAVTVPEPALPAALLTTLAAR